MWGTVGVELKHGVGVELKYGVRVVLKHGVWVELKHGVRVELKHGCGLGQVWCKGSLRGCVEEGVGRMC